MAKSLVVIGSESTGKSVLARALGACLGGHVVPERLRLWCEQHGRVPRADEQQRIFDAQVADWDRHLHSSDGQAGGWVIVDSGPLMIAAYSEYYFGDPSLWTKALKLLENASIVLWCRPAGVWVADPGMRDGIAVQHAVDQLLENRLGPGVAWGEVQALRGTLARCLIGYPHVQVPSCFVHDETQVRPPKSI